MRTIRFRGKRLDNKEWVYGNYFHNFRKGESHNIIDFKSNEWFLINIETLEQYTGLKDKNGVEIYEGDLICYKDGEIAEIYFCDEESQYRTIQNGFNKELYSRPFTKRSTVFTAIIGNIHDNPELLK